MQTTRPLGRTPQRGDAHSHRGRILATARRTLRDDPEASLDSIARAAGVARRTLYGHFPGRQALIAGLTREAAHELRQAFAAARAPDADPVEAMTRMVLAGRRHPGEDAIRAALAPAREEAAATLRRGQREDVFADHLPAPVLAHALEALMPALAEENAAHPWADPTGEAAATAFLVAAGVAPQAAALQVRDVVRRDRAAGAG
ncbi:helix-turn-helix domain-containing protein [Streptomyces sp. NPDC052301]|uniref:helix-turn-helix domain-containing protein n=1 Tax=Streptomyces sp. NPDC052301 TaxID=3365687 RepID=UPI0037D93FA2